MTARRYLLPLALALVLLALPSSAGAYVFWSNESSSAGPVLERANPDGTSLVPEVAGDVNGFASVAANAHNVFFLTQIVEGPNPEELGSPVWARENLDGGERIDLPDIPFNTEAIAVDEEHVYWEEFGKISRARLDGSDPELGYLPSVPGLGQFFAVYNGFLYWTYREGDSIGRANLTTKQIDEEFVPEWLGADIPEEPMGIAVDSQGIFWTYFTSPGWIGHAGLVGGGADTSFIGTADAIGGAIAITESELYWFTGFSIGHAHLDGGGASLVDLHFHDHSDEDREHGLAANAASSPAPPGPPPPPVPGPGTTPAPPPPPTPAPLKILPAPKLKLNAKGGTATLTLAAPGPGQVVLSGAGIKKLHKSVKAAGPVALLVRPNAATAKKLKRTGSAKVAAKLTFTPPAGDPSSRLVKLTLKLAAGS